MVYDPENVARNTDGLLLRIYRSDGCCFAVNAGSRKMRALFSIEVQCNE